MRLRSLRMTGALGVQSRPLGSSKRKSRLIFVAFSVFNWEEKMKTLRIAGGVLALAAGLLLRTGGCAGAPPVDLMLRDQE